MYNQEDIGKERIERIERVKKPVPLAVGDHALIEPYDDVMSGTASVLGGVASLRGNDSRDFVRSNDSLLGGQNTPGQYAPAEYVGGSWTFGNSSAALGGGRNANQDPFAARSDSARSRTDSFTTNPGLSAPLRVQNAAESEFSYAAGSSSGAGGSEVGTLIGSNFGYSDKKGGKAKSTAPSLPADALASEVAELRREIMQMRSANASVGGGEMGMDVAPPSYEDDLLMAGSSSGGDQDPVMRRPVDVKKKI